MKGIGGDAHCELDDEVGEAGGGPGRRMDEVDDDGRGWGRRPMRRREALRLDLALADGAEEDSGAPRLPPERRGGLWPRARRRHGDGDVVRATEEGRVLFLLCFESHTSVVLQMESYQTTACQPC